MTDILDQLATSAIERIESGYYQIEDKGRASSDDRSFVSKITEDKLNPVIAEIKAGSPSTGNLGGDGFNPLKRGISYLQGGAVGVSVLTDPDHFSGSLHNLEKVSGLGSPVLMKDFVLDYSQIETGKWLGADAILLIYRLFSRGYPTCNLGEAIDYAHKLGLEVLLETNDAGEYESSLNTEADMAGINNRNLRSLEVDLSTTKNILGKMGKDRIVWSMSGISTREDIQYLEDAGADAFLVGTSLTQSSQPEKLVRQLRGG